MAGIADLMAQMQQRSGGRGQNPQLQRLAQLFMQQRKGGSMQPPAGKPMRPGAMPPQGTQGGGIAQAAKRPEGGPRGLGIGGDMGKRGGGLPDSASAPGGMAFGGGLKDAMAAARGAGSPMGQTAQNYISAAKAAVPGFGPGPVQNAVSSATQGTMPGRSGQVSTGPEGGMPSPGGSMEEVIKRLMERMRTNGGQGAPQGVPFGVMPPGANGRF
jgi:hypothetical protein